MSKHIHFSLAAILYPGMTFDFHQYHHEKFLKKNTRARGAGRRHISGPQHFVRESVALRASPATMGLDGWDDSMAEPSQGCQ